MNCTKPLPAFAIEGQLTANGKQVLKFSEPDKSVPFNLIKIPCGNCIKCRLAKAGAWANQLEHESAFHKKNCCVTLTYSEENLPYGSTLIKAHPQKFIRALRKKVAPHKLRYFVCGEYGDPAKGVRQDNPHYHMIIFGYDFEDKIPVGESTPRFFNKILEPSDYSEPVHLWDSAELQDLWQHGDAKLGVCSPDTMSYVSGYVVKKILGEKAETHYSRLVEETGELIQLQPEYANMSLKPGIGADHVEKYADYLLSNDRVHHKNAVMALPKYYDQRLEILWPDGFADMKAKRTAFALQNASLGDDTDSRNNAREVCATAQHNNKTPIGSGSFRGVGATAADLTSQSRNLT